MVTIKEELLVLGIRASGFCLRQVAFIIRQVAIIMRQVAVTCRHNTSVVRNLKFLTPFFIFLTIEQHYTIYEP